MSFHEKVVILTGASRGIGRATAKALAAEGARLVLAYQTKNEHTLELVQELSLRTQIVDVVGNIAHHDTVQKILTATTEKFGRADILINNAGAITGFGDVTPESFDEDMHTNLMAPILMTQAFAPLLQMQSGANIINIASTYGMMGAAPVAAYTAAKAGLINYTQSMARTLAPSIRVNAIAPGNIDTEMTARAGEEFIHETIQNTPMKRLGRPEDIAEAVLFLGSDRARFITGHTLVVDGGHLLVN